MAGVAASARGGAAASDPLSGATRGTGSFMVCGGTCTALAQASMLPRAGETREKGMSAIATDPQEPRFPVIREAVSSFPGKTELPDAAARLLADGFKPAPLSVRATRDFLGGAGRCVGRAD